MVQEEDMKVRGIERQKGDSMKRFVLCFALLSVLTINGGLGRVHADTKRGISCTA